ncbi:MAG: M20 family metallo-hydrolase [Cyclobacteriaceae bacterium]
MSESEQAVKLLQDLIRTPSFSKEEYGTRKVLAEFLEKKGIEFTNVKNNLFALNKHFDPGLPTLLLNSHHDTVKPNAGYTRDPFEPDNIDGKIYGLGSNDAGGALVALIVTFCSFYDQKELPVNLILGISAEEEISGPNGAELLLQNIPKVNAGIVGEPTSGEAAVTEKGLLVLDCTVTGKAGHAARSEGENAIYKAMQDIEWFRSFEFPETSNLLGPIHMNVTVIKAGSQHNVVPDVCEYTVDIRTTDAYTLEETLQIIDKNTIAEVKPRSLRLRPSALRQDHVLYKAAEKCGFRMFGSPTLSDQARMPFPTIKIGPGDSSRSHSPDEFIFIHQIEQGINDYKKLIESYFKLNTNETLG